MTRPANPNPNDRWLDRALPCNLEAERSILASILIDNNLCHQAIELIKPEDFYRDSHRRIYEHMLQLSEQSMPIDIVTLQSSLSRSGELEQVGGITFLSNLLDGVGHITNLESYAYLLKQQSMLRRAIKACQEGITACLEQSDDAESIIDQIEKDIFEISEDRIRTGFTHISEVANNQLKRLDDAAQRPEILTGLQTGFTDLDRLTNGLQPSDLIIVAARPSMGKTAFCLNIAQNVAVRSEKSVGVFSLEMSKESLVTRLLCSEACVDAQRLRGGFLSPDEWKELGQALGTLTRAKIFIDDSPGITVMEMRAKARRLKSQHGLDLVIVDYLQLIRSRGRFENRQTEVSQISRDLKALAKELSVPLIALSQLSRASESRSDHRPMLSDLRESGCISGDSLITLADTGTQVPIRNLVGQAGFAVWALNEVTMKLERATVTHAFATGVKPVSRLTTQLGRSIYATANHKFRASEGWKRLDELRIGECLAIPCIEHAVRMMEASNSVELAKVVYGDVFWDEIVSIEPCGETDVYDLTVDHFHNFISCNLLVHNSLEQDADVVGFIYREEMYTQTEENDGVAELIIAKQRNGPTGSISLAFIKAFTRFDNMWRER